MVALPAGETSVPSVPNVVDGQDAPPVGGDWLLRSSPATGEPVCRFPRSAEPDVLRAVEAARQRQPAWAALTPVRRGDIIRRAAELLRADEDALVRSVCAETGKPARDARGELGAAVEMGYFVAGEGRRLYGRTTTSAVPNKRVTLVRSPIGVAGLIVASNTPLPNYAWKVFPALVCGNTAVLKASEDTPLSAYQFVRILHEAGCPPGVVNLVNGLGPEAGAALVNAPDVDIVSFTGSVAVGRSIQVQAGQRMAKICLELGGKNPMIVCDDADLGAAASAAAASAFSNAGQRCAAGSRIIVFADVYDEFVGLLLEKTKELRVGTSDDADLGPVINERRLDEMLDAIDGARRAGVRVLAGGSRLKAEYAEGCFLEPTLLEGADPHDPISRSELFGPIACLYRVPDFAGALRLANDSPFGLTASVFTRSIHRAMVFVDQIQAGMAVVNGPTFGSEPHMPFGGFKQSGNGAREAGTEVLDVYSGWKSVCFIHDPEQV